ncbi:MAG: hypothetical protein FWC11_00220 [Firmicutes bacterium]|nr:hypothetical protein [Bacillota bacterium]
MKRKLTALIVLMALLLMGAMFTACNGETYHTVTLIAPPQTTLTVAYENEQNVTRTLNMGANQVRDGEEVYIITILSTDPNYFSYLYINGEQQEQMTSITHVITQNTTIELRMVRQ